MAENIAIAQMRPRIMSPACGIASKKTTLLHPQNKRDREDQSIPNTDPTSKAFISTTCRLGANKDRDPLEKAFKKDRNPEKA